MGDKAHAVIVDGNSKVYLYTHWTGSELPDTVRRALKSAQEAGRLDDGPYLARIVFCHMLLSGSSGASAALGDVTGFGISSRPCEDTSRDVTIDCGRGTVQLPGRDAVPLSMFLAQQEMPL